MAVTWKSNQYKDFLEKHGFKHIRYHDLRHTNLSMLMTKMSAVDVAKIGGHKQVSTTTDIYGHSAVQIIWTIVTAKKI